MPLFYEADGKVQGIRKRLLLSQLYSDKPGEGCTVFSSLALSENGPLVEFILNAAQGQGLSETRGKIKVSAGMHMLRRFSVNFSLFFLPFVNILSCDHFRLLSLGPVERR